MKADDVTTKDVGKNKVSYIDDEYAEAGIKDPKVIMTTCREPTNKLTRFVKEMKLCFPNATRVNRGNIDVKELVRLSKAAGFTDLVIFHEHSGICDGIIVCHLPYGPTAYFSVTDVVARHDVPKKSLASVSEQIPHLVFNNFQTLLGERVCNVLKFLYPVVPNQKISQKIRRVISFTNFNDFILFRHHIYRKKENNEIELVEIGPRFTMRLYQIKLGTIDQKESPIEWVLRPYFNTSWKRKAL
ncbi:hypothetical protein RFI_25493 [Reticulomyxa filosa]|uniref:Brix domain-containing protein n=1 Tax=Reticulomyxa filosa TaxID=46433 RepID=X6MDF1_RETFI|nr:hypothetical protein RFI_25493 [Reticulomyxa filosa]|eukprot:ETO11884.1 hypothetical protein RFI_25493 [Reticulomyxa filosa]